MTTAAGSTPANIFPCLYYRDATAAIEWLCRTFGFVQRMSAPGADGTIAHAELSFGDGVIMVASCKPEQGWVSPLDLPAVNQAISVYVPDPDAHYARAKSAGAEIVRDIQDENTARAATWRKTSKAITGTLETIDPAAIGLTETIGALHAAVASGANRFSGRAHPTRVD